MENAECARRRCHHDGRTSFPKADRCATALERRSGLVLGHDLGGDPPLLSSGTSHSFERKGFDETCTASMISCIFRQERERIGA